MLCIVWNMWYVWSMWYVTDLWSQIQQGSKEKAKYSSSWDCARQLYRRGGITNVYRGTMATLLRGMVAKGCGCYDMITCDHRCSRQWSILHDIRVVIIVTDP